MGSSNKIYFTMQILLVIFLAMMGCSFDYEGTEIAESLDKELPDIQLEHAKIVFVRGTKLTIETEKIEIFSSKKSQTMYNVKFKEEDRKQNVRTIGSADKVTIETDTNNVTLVGNIKTRSNNDEAEILTDYLYWNDEEKTIKGSDVSKVEIVKDIGSTISGYGFYADTEKRTLEIKSQARGQLVVEEEDSVLAQDEDDASLSTSDAD